MKAYASAPGSSNTTCNVRSRTRFVRAHELVEAALAEHAVAGLVGVGAVRRARRLAVQQHAERDRLATGAGQDEVRVAGMEPEGDAPAGLRGA